MSFIQELADELAKDVLESQEELGSDTFYEQVGRVLLTASPTLQEAYMTSIHPSGRTAGPRLPDEGAEGETRGRQGPRRAAGCGRRALRCRTGRGSTRNSPS